MTKKAANRARSAAKGKKDLAAMASRYRAGTGSRTLRAEGYAKASWHKVQLSEAMAERLRLLAECHGCSKSVFLRRAILEGLDALGRDIILTLDEAKVMSRSQRREFARHRWSILRHLDPFFPSGN